MDAEQPAPVKAMGWGEACVRLAGLAFAALLISKGWIFWPVIIAIMCLLD